MLELRVKGKTDSFMAIALVALLGIFLGWLTVWLQDFYWGNLVLLAGLISLCVLLALALWFNRLGRLLLLIAFFLPVEMVPGAVNIGYEDMDLTTPLLLLSLVYLSVLTLSTRRLRWRYTPLDFFILLFVLAQIFVSLSSPWPVETLIRYIKYDKVFVMYYIFVIYMRSESRIKLAVRLYVFSAVVVAGYGVLAFVVFVVSGYRMWGLGFSWGYLPRIFGTMRDQNIFAAYMITPCLLLVSAFLTARRRERKLVLLAALVCVGLAILLTWSRSGFLGLFVGALCYAALNRQALCRRAVTVLCLSLVLVLLVSVTAFAIGYSPIVLYERFTGSAKGTAQSDLMHYALAKLAWQVFLKHPMGVGRSNLLKYVDSASPDVEWIFVNVFQIQADGTYREGKSMPVHSSWLEILVSEGLIGFLAFLAIVFLVVKKGIESARLARDGPMAWTLESFVAGFCGVLVSAWFYTFDWMYFFWFIVSMIVVTCLTIRQSRLEALAC